MHSNVETKKKYAQKIHTNTLLKIGVIKLLQKISF